MRPDPSELAAAAWIAGGVVATAAVQAATGGRHSVSAGLRRHPVATVLLAAAFAAHLTRRPACLARLDPFAAIGQAATAITRARPL